ncbi:MAG: COX15/CtaA family protein [bacterium]|nr:COX15/CtaA family protein [bacterium]MDE0600826.1 COX15/CtaA family protein [bacterium]
MPQVAVGTHAGQARYRIVTLLSLIAAIAQIVLGGVVRVTGSGDACPDWPLCHGQIIPPFDYHIWLEFTHRLVATAVGLLVLASLVLAWRHYRTSKPVMLAMSASMVLVVAAAILGGLTVLSELSWWTRLIHLGLAELTVAALAIAWLAGPPGDQPGRSQSLESKASRRDRTMAWAGLAGLLVVILYGSYMVGVGYGAICSGWPLCLGERNPAGTPFLIHMIHRYMVAIVAVFVFRACIAAWKRGVALAQLRWMAVLTAGFLMIEIGVGAFTAWLGSSPFIAALHLTFATLSWVSMVLMMAVHFDPGTFRVRTKRGRTAA